VTGTFALFDTVNFVVPARRVLPPFLAVLAVAVVTPWPVLAVAAGAVVMTLLAPNHFAADERGRLDTLYATLPVSARTVVLGRYVSLVLLYLATAVFSTGTAVVVGLVTGEPVAADVLVPVNLGAFVFFCGATAVQLPFFFALGYTRARPLVYVPVVLLSGTTWLLGQTDVFDGLDPASLASADPAVLWSAGLVLSLGLLVASAAVSTRLYRRRDL
jgi:hypothetical protein